MLGRKFIERFKDEMARDPLLEKDPELQASMVDLCAESVFIVDPKAHDPRTGIMDHFIKECRNRFKEKNLKDAEQLTLDVVRNAKTENDVLQEMLVELSKQSQVVLLFANNMITEMAGGPLIKPDLPPKQAF